MWSDGQDVMLLKTNGEDNMFVLHLIEMFQQAALQIDSYTPWMPRVNKILNFPILFYKQFDNSALK